MTDIEKQLEKKRRKKENRRQEHDLGTVDSEEVYDETAIYCGVEYSFAVPTAGRLDAILAILSKAGENELAISHHVPSIVNIIFEEKDAKRLIAHYERNVAGIDLDSADSNVTAGWIEFGFNSFELWQETFKEVDKKKS